jgi:hypothetical protein
MLLRSCQLIDYPTIGGPFPTKPLLSHRRVNQPTDSNSRALPAQQKRQSGRQAKSYHHLPIPATHVPARGRRTASSPRQAFLSCHRASNSGLLLCHAVLRGEGASQAGLHKDGLFGWHHLWRPSEAGRHPTRTSQDPHHQICYNSF